VTISGAEGDAAITGAEVSAGTYVLSESSMAGYAQDGPWVCTGGGTFTTPDQIALGLADDVTCTVTNKALARIKLYKTVVGEPTDQDYNFTLSGPGVSEDVWVSGLTSPTTFNDALLQLDETYTVCEVVGGWASVWTWNKDGHTAELTLDYSVPGQVCYAFTPTDPDDAGFIFEFRVDNRPQGDPRTIGYWSNWNMCTGGRQAETAAKNGGYAEGFWLLEDVLPLELGLPGVPEETGITVSTCGDGVNILNKSNLSGDKLANDAAYSLAAQLLAAKANQGASAGCMPSDFGDKIDEADELLSRIGFDGMGNFLGPQDEDPTNDRQNALELADYFDWYNNGGICVVDESMGG
jgi:hypothetical protein